MTHETFTTAKTKKKSSLCKQHNMGHFVPVGSQYILTRISWQVLQEKHGFTSCYFWWHVNWQHMNSPSFQISPHSFLPSPHHIWFYIILFVIIYFLPHNYLDTSMIHPLPPIHNHNRPLLHPGPLFLLSVKKCFTFYVIQQLPHPPPPTLPVLPPTQLYVWTWASHYTNLSHMTSVFEKDYSLHALFTLSLHALFTLSLSKEDCLYTGADWLRIICPSDGGRGQLNTLTTKAAELGTVDLSPGGKFCADSSSIVLAVNNFILTHTSSWGSHAWKRRKPSMYVFFLFFVCFCVCKSIYPQVHFNILT